MSRSEPENRPLRESLGRVVDVHCHAIPPELVAAINRGAFDGVAMSMDGGGRFLFPDASPSPDPEADLSDFQRLAEDAVRQGITVRLVGPWTDLFGYTLPRHSARAWTVAYNDGLVEACESDAVLEPIGMVPLQYPDLAVSMVEYAKSIGCRGLMIGTDLPDSDLGASELDEFWAAVAAMEMPVVIHPSFLNVPKSLTTRGLKNALGRGGASAVGLTALIYGGVLERHPKVAIIATHGGGSLLHLMPRILRNQELGYAQSDVDVEQSVARLYWDSAVLEPAVLSQLVSRVGSDRVVLGSDSPFLWEPDPVGTVLDAGLSTDAILAIVGRTAEVLFGLTEH